MDEQPRASLNLSLPCNRRAPAAVRQALSCLGALGPSLGDVKLVASELVACAVRHSDNAGHPGDGAGPGAIDVEVRRFDQRLDIRVHDPADSQGAAQVPQLADCAADGLGRLIVEELTSRWGSERRDGYAVWAELPLTLYANA